MIYVTRFQNEAVLGFEALSQRRLFSAKRNGRGSVLSEVRCSVVFTVAVEIVPEGEQFNGCEVAVGKRASPVCVPS